MLYNFKLYFYFGGTITSCLVQVYFRNDYLFSLSPLSLTCAKVPHQYITEIVKFRNTIKIVCWTACYHFTCHVNCMQLWFWLLSTRVSLHSNSVPDDICHHQQQKHPCNFYVMQFKMSLSWGTVRKKKHKRTKAKKNIYLSPHPKKRKRIELEKHKYCWKLFIVYSFLVFRMELLFDFFSLQRKTFEFQLSAFLTTNMVYDI